MKNLVKHSFFRIVLLVLVVGILGLLFKKYVANRERFFYANSSGEFVVPVGFRKDGTIKFKLLTDFNEKDNTMCDLCYKINSNNNDQSECKLNVFNKQTDPNTKKISYTRAPPQGCPSFCNNNDCPEKPVIDIKVPNSSNKDSSNKNIYIGKDIDGKTVMHVNCGKITNEASCAAHINCDFCGKNSKKKCISTNLRDNKLKTPNKQCSRIKVGISKEYCKKVEEGIETNENCYPAIEEEDTVWNSIKNFFNVKSEGNKGGSNNSTGGSIITTAIPNKNISNNEVPMNTESMQKVLDNLEKQLEASSREKDNLSNFSYNGNINEVLPFDTAFSPITGTSSVSEFSKYKNYLK